MHAFLIHLINSKTLRFGAVLQITLALIISAFCGEIHDAAKAGDLAKVKALLENNPDLVLTTHRGLAPLHYAAQNGHQGVAELLLAKGADVNAQGDWLWTGLYVMADGHITFVDSLKANKDEAADCTWTPLFAAVYGGYKDVAELLLANKADVNTKGNRNWTPLHVAALQNKKDMAELLLANGARANARDKDGKTPLHYAAQNGYKDVSALLLANGAEINARDNSGWMMPLHLAAGNGHKNVVELLLANGAEINARPSGGWTPLRWAAAYGRKDVAELLRQHGGHE
jgi:ankyrin repeat protein